MGVVGKIVHPFDPIADENSRILILGTMPSPASVRDGFYYGHPANRFWSVISAVLGKNLPESREDKVALLLSEGIALWDVLASCEIEGASDASIKNPVVNDLASLVNSTKINTVAANGAAAFRLYEKLAYSTLGIPAVRLPSTSPANAAWTLPRLIEAWRTIKPPRT